MLRIAFTSNDIGFATTVEQLNPLIASFKIMDIDNGDRKKVGWGKSF